MKIEYALTLSDPKSVALVEVTSSSSNRSSSLTRSDLLTALGITLSRQRLGLHLLYAKYKKDNKEREKATELLFKIALSLAPKSVDKVVGRYKIKAIEMVTRLAIEDYCRTADTPGAKCRCGGRGKVYDFKASQQQNRPIEKVCSRCNGLGIKRVPASKAYKIVTTLLPELSIQSWSRNWKPFYELLIQRCYSEASLAIHCYDQLINVAVNER